jgi:hypothetical protein
MPPPRPLPAGVDMRPDLPRPVRAGLPTTTDHTRCDRIRMMLAEVGLDPDRVFCTDDPNSICSVGAGIGDEGRFTIEEIDRLTDKAIELAGWEA